MAGIDFMAYAKGAEYANTLNQKDELFARQREAEQFNMQKAQQEMGYRQADMTEKADARIASQSMVNLAESVKRLVQDGGMKPEEAWLSLARNASLDGATPQQEALFQAALTRQIEQLAAGAYQRRDFTQGDALRAARGLPGATNQNAINAYSNPAEMLRQVRERAPDAMLTPEGKIMVGGQAWNPEAAYANFVGTGGAALDQNVAENARSLQTNAVGAQQAQALTAQQNQNTAQTAAQILLNYSQVNAQRATMGQQPIPVPPGLYEQAGLPTPQPPAAFMPPAGYASQLPAQVPSTSAEGMVNYVPRSAPAGYAAALPTDATTPRVDTVGAYETAKAQSRGLAEATVALQRRGLLNPQLYQTVQTRQRLLLQAMREYEQQAQAATTQAGKEAAASALAQKQAALAGENARLLATVQSLLQ